MSTHIITIDLGYGLEQVEVDDRTLVGLRLAASKARLKRHEEQVRRTRESFRRFAESAGNAWGLGGSQTIFDEAFAGAGWVDEERWNNARTPFGAEQTAYHDAPSRPAPAPTRPSTPHTTPQAVDVLAHYMGESVAHNRDAIRKALRRAKRATHPDTGGTSADFQLVTAAEDVLRTAHWI